MDTALPAEFASWPAKVAVVSAVSAGELSNAMIAPGRAASVTLHGTREVTFPVQPEKPGGSVAHASGLLAFSIDQPGTYRIAISSGAWLDVIKDGQALISTSHWRGPACSTVRKMVEFALQPGPYALQISANPDPIIGPPSSRGPANLWSGRRARRRRACRHGLSRRSDSRGGGVDEGLSRASAG